MLEWQALTDSLSITFSMVAFLEVGGGGAEEEHTLHSSTGFQVFRDLVDVTFVLKGRV